MADVIPDFDTWLGDCHRKQEAPSADSFATSAIGPLEQIETLAVPLNYKRWGFNSQAEMEAAWREDDAA